jgi:hypothetical protein
MRYFLTLLLCCLMASRALAGGVYRVDITAYGIMSAPVKVRIGTSSNGIPYFLVHGARIVQAATRIPACMGTQFGFRYAVIGAPQGMPINIVDAFVFPQSGLHKPGVSSPIHDTRFMHSFTVGDRGGIWYEFDNSWELVPGEWTLELWDANRLLASRTFTVVRPKPGECPNLSS